MGHALKGLCSNFDRSDPDRSSVAKNINYSASRCSNETGGAAKSVAR
jgi:hypothetical protein